MQTFLIVAYFVSVVFNFMCFYFTGIIKTVEDESRYGKWVVDLFFVALAIVPIVNTVAMIAELMIIALAFVIKDDEDEDEESEMWIDH